MTTLQVHHRTRYRYERPVSFGVHRLMLRPRDGHDMRIIDSTLTLSMPRGWRMSAQFLPDRVAAFRRIAGQLKPNGRLAVTHQPRHRGASAADAERFAGTIASEMSEAGFVRSEKHCLPLVPVPAICIIGSAAADAD